jgi:galactokinase
MPIGPDPRRIDRLIAALSAALPAASEGGATARTAGATGDIELARAPARVNLLGDNTEYNEGFVLPVAIGLETWIAFRRRRDGLVRTAALGARKIGAFWIDDLAPLAPSGASASGDFAGSGAVAGSGDFAGSGAVAGSGDFAGSDDLAAAGTAATSNASPAWPDYVAATAWSLREAGLPIRGFDGVIDSTIPPGIGLSQGAALELASALALLSGSAVLAGPALAALAQLAERDYLGLAAGIVDQFAGAAGRDGRALLLDCRSLESRTLALPWGLRVVVCDTGSTYGPNSGAELARRAECGRAVALLAERVPWVCSLRDVDSALLHRYRGLLPDAVARRAEHVVAENARVVAAAPAMEAGDLDELGRLFSASHASLRNLYDAGTPALDAMVEVALSVPGVVAARMAGGTAGGRPGRCTVNLVLAEAVPALVAAVENDYRRRTGLAGAAYPVAVVDGAGTIRI